MTREQKEKRLAELDREREQLVKSLSILDLSPLSKLLRVSVGIKWDQARLNIGIGRNSLPIITAGSFDIIDPIHGGEYGGCIHLAVNDPEWTWALEDNLDIGPQAKALMVRHK